MAGRTGKTKKPLTLGSLLLLLAAVLISQLLNQWLYQPSHSVKWDEIPKYSGNPYVVIQDNQPGFTAEDMTDACYEFYAPLDSLGRCGYTMACIGLETMPTKPRGDISSVKPSGWNQAFYAFVDGEALYNRCHLIGFQLTGENANERNLITGTRTMNTEGMLPFENMVADYIRETGNHVIYRVTPIYVDDELVARGVQMEAKSVEDDSICFHVFVYNMEPGVTIDYSTGKSKLSK